jgi:hypothetical protein
LAVEISGEFLKELTQKWQNIKIMFGLMWMASGVFF